MEKAARAVSMSRVGHAIGMRASFAILSFLLTLLLARTMGPKSFGEYSYLLSIFMLVLLPATSGVSRYNVLKVAESDDSSYTSRLLYAELKLTTFLMALALITASLLLIRYGLGANLLLVAVYPVAVWCAYETSILRGLGRTTVGNVDAMILRPMIMIIALGGLAVSGVTITVQTSIIVFTASFVIARIILQPFMSLPSIIRLIKGGGSYLLPGPYIILLTIIGSIEAIFFHVDSLLIAVLANEEQVGFYRVSAAIKNFALMPMTAMNLFLPYIFAKYVQGNYEKIASEVNSITTLNFIYLILFVASFAFVGEALVAFMFGDKFLPAYSIVLPTLAAVTFSGIFGPAVEGLLGAGGARYLVISFACIFPLHIVMTLYCIPLYGAFGASIAWSISHALLVCFSAILLYRLYGRRMGLLNFRMFDNFLRHRDT